MKLITIILSALVAFSAVSTAADFSQSSYLADTKPAKKVKGEIKEVTFNVHLHCNNCVKKLQENIAFEKGVKDLHICMEDQIVAIKYDASKTNEETLKNAIVKLGVPVKGVSHGGHQHK
ncbi:MAG: cation transporter [Bacteroidales bacterium]|nr:cation transporter [Bacteroidales bacterium]